MGVRRMRTQHNMVETAQGLVRGGYPRQRYHKRHEQVVPDERANLYENTFELRGLPFSPAFGDRAY